MRAAAIPVFLLVVAVAAPMLAQQGPARPITLKGHTLGEPQGQLVVIYVGFSDEAMASNAEIEEDSIKKFGKPTLKTSQDMMNAYGAQWKDYALVWVLPNAYITLTLHNNPARRSASLSATTPEEHARTAALPKMKGPLE